MIGEDVCGGVEGGLCVVGFRQRGLDIRVLVDDKGVVFMCV